MSCVFFLFGIFFGGGRVGVVIWGSVASNPVLAFNLICRWGWTWSQLLPVFASAGSAAYTTEPTEIAVNNLKSVGVVSSLWSQLLRGAIGILDYVVCSSQRGQNNLILTKAVQWCFIAGVNKNIVLLLSLFLISVLFLCCWELLFLFLKCSLVITKKNSFVCWS